MEKISLFENPKDTLKLLDKEQLRLCLKSLNRDELSYFYTLYAGPSKVLIRNKFFNYETAQHVTFLINQEIFYREFESQILS
jgi:hypothetical protein